MGYEGDTCSFTCNTGYELTGSDTRTCQSDGSWSGSNDVCRRGKFDDYIIDLDILVSCSSFNNSNNGIISYSLGNDNVTSYDDTCSLMCNTGYGLTSRDTKTCKSDENRSGSDGVCRRDSYIML